MRIGRRGRPPTMADRPADPLENGIFKSHPGFDLYPICSLFIAPNRRFYPLTDPNG